MCSFHKFFLSFTPCVLRLDPSPLLSLPLSPSLLFNTMDTWRREKESVDKWKKGKKKVSEIVTVGDGWLMQKQLFSDR